MRRLKQQQTKCSKEYASRSGTPRFLTRTPNPMPFFRINVEEQVEQTKTAQVKKKTETERKKSNQFISLNTFIFV